MEDGPHIIYRIYANYKNERDSISSRSLLSGTYERVFQLGSHYTQIEIEHNTPWRTAHRFFNIGPTDEDIPHDLKVKEKLAAAEPEDGTYIVLKTMSTVINHLGSVVSRGNTICTLDTDGDIVCDELNAAPGDPSVAFEEWIPSLLGKGSLAFEGHWPAYGEYDFNDLVIKYKYKKHLDASNVMVRMIGYYDVTAIGASYNNGFGFQLDMNPAVINSITGFVHGKGLEVGQSIPTVILFE